MVARVEPSLGAETAAVGDDPDELTRQAPPPEAPVVLPPSSRLAPSPYVTGPTDLFAPAADQPSFDAAPLTTDDKRSRLAALDDKEVRGCTKCRLCEARTNTVFGEGDADAHIFFIGEGPGETEDLTGRPFVGRAGEMLNKWIAGDRMDSKVHDEGMKALRRSLQINREQPRIVELLSRYAG